MVLFGSPDLNFDAPGFSKVLPEPVLGRGHEGGKMGRQRVGKEGEEKRGRRRGEEGEKKRLLLQDWWPALLRDDNWGLMVTAMLPKGTHHHCV